MHSRAMNKYQIRRNNLQRILEQRFGGVVKKLADAIDKDASYVSRMLWDDSKKGAKRIGEDMADAICNALGYPVGALDREEGDAVPPRGGLSSVEPGPDIRGQVPLIDTMPPQDAVFLRNVHDHLKTREIPDKVRKALLALMESSPLKLEKESDGNDRTGPVDAGSAENP